MDNCINVVIIDDHNIIIEGLEMLLGFHKDINILKSYNDANDFINDLRNQICRPHIVLMDLMMPAISGFEAAKLLKKEYPEIRIIILSMDCAAKTIFDLIEKTGVEGYLSKKISAKELYFALKQVHSGYVYLSPEAANALDSFKEKIISYPVFKLSDREKQIVKLMFAGFSNSEIADELFISISTVETHRKNIYRKTETHSIPKLMQIVADLQLLDGIT